MDSGHCKYLQKSSHPTEQKQESFERNDGCVFYLKEADTIDLGSVLSQLAPGHASRDRGDLKKR
jgi:hypothetical protein